MTIDTENPTREKNILLTALNTGWGHLITAQCLSENLPKAVLLPPPSPSVIPTFALLDSLHTATQHKDSQGQDKGWRRAETNELLNQLPYPKRLFFELALPFFENCMATGRRSRWEDFLTEHPSFAKPLYRLAVALNYSFITPEIRCYFQNAASCPNSIRITTHGATLGQEGGINVILDPGFPFSGTNFAPKNLLAMLSRGGINLVPTQFQRETLAKYFGKEAFYLGTIGQTMTPEEVREKWEGAETETSPFIILAATSGNAVNLDEILRIKNDFFRYSLHRDNAPSMRLLIFLGEHSDTELISQIAEGVTTLVINDTSDLQSLPRRVHTSEKAILVIRTTNLPLTAKAKLQLARLAHIEAVKPGEASFMNPHTATFSYFLTPAGPNEPMNGIWAVMAFGGAIFSPNERWRKIWDDFTQSGIYFLLNSLRQEELLPFAFASMADLRRRTERIAGKGFPEQVSSLQQDGQLPRMAIEAYCRARNLVYPLQEVLARNAPIEKSIRELSDGGCRRIFAEIEQERRRKLADLL